MTAARPIVYKFGGTSVGSPEALLLAVERVREAAPNVVAVVSAPNGVTDLLLETARAASIGEITAARELAQNFSTRYSALAKAVLTTPEAVANVLTEIDNSTRELVLMCASLHILRELTTKTSDVIAARGERLLALIFAALLEEHQVQSTLIDAAAVVRTEKRHGSVWPDFDLCKDAAEELILPELRSGRIVVLPGFIGSGVNGEVVTLGRGGSDFSAAIVARSIGASMLTLWKEVDGLMTADPRMVSTARVIPQLHYREAGELAYYGAKVLHPRTMIPLLDGGIPLTVRNSFNPSFGGTVIASDVSTGQFPVKALTSVPRQALVAVEGSGMMGVPGIAARTFGALSAAGHSVSMISQASSEASICFVVPEPEAADAVRSLEEAFRFELEARLIERITVEHDIALVAVVGLGMRGTPGIAARVFSALAGAHVNVVSIAQGSSELNITAAIRDADVAPAVNALHKEFQLQKIHALQRRDRHESSISLLGFGQIGRALTRQIVAQEPYFRDDLGIRLKNVALADRSGLLVNASGFTGAELADLLVRKEAGARLSNRSNGDSTSIQTLINELREQVHVLPASRSIVVDLTADDTAPLLLEALERGCHIVIANKKPLAVAQTDFDRMMEVARAERLSFRYEATVGAGLPILDSLAKLKDAGDEVERILGCLSGTIGYLMTQLEDGIAYSDAVRRAHALGYTEPDPRDDLSGIDVARKALILARTIGRKLELSDIAVEPLFPHELSDDDPEVFLRNLEQIDEEMRMRVVSARNEHKVLRYIARLEGERITVGLEAVPESHPMGRLRGTDNQIVLGTRRYQSNPLIVTGPGAGAEVTAAGVLNDIVSITRQQEQGAIGT